jgi:acyl-CoA thioesterase-2
VGRVGFNEAFALQRLGEDEFIAEPPGVGFQFGGLTMGTALVAAAQTVRDGLVPKSLHTYFLRPGQWGAPTEFSITRPSDGRSFAARQISVRQNDKTLAVVSASFHQPGSGLDWQDSEGGRLAPPDELADAAVMLPEADLIEVRPVRPALGDPMRESVHPYWSRSGQPLAADPAQHAGVLTFISDYLVILSMLATGLTVTEPTGLRTLDHSVWFHRPVDAHEWLLYSSDPVSVSQGRGLTRGAIRAADGRLVASFNQEVIIPG